MIYGYARVSTEAQDLTSQLAQLTAAGCEKVFREKLTGTNADRPQLQKLIIKLAPGDVVIIPAVEREVPGAPGLLSIGGASPGWEKEQRRYYTYAHLGLALALVGTMMEAVPPICTAFGSARRRRRPFPSTDNSGRITVPGPGQTVHLLTKRGVLGVLWNMRRDEGRNVHELKFYTTDDLRRLYQTEKIDPIRLSDGIVSRVQLEAMIRWRVWWERFGYVALLLVSVIAALGALAGAVFASFAWRFPVPPPNKTGAARDRIFQERLTMFSAANGFRG